jgi:hypothetical protein
MHISIPLCLRALSFQETQQAGADNHQANGRPNEKFIFSGIIYKIQYTSSCS